MLHKPIFAISALVLMLRHCSAVNTCLRTCRACRSLGEGRLKDFLERSKIFFNLPSLKLRQAQQVLRQVFTAEQCRSIRTSAEKKLSLTFFFSLLFISAHAEHTFVAHVWEPRANHTDHHNKSHQDFSHDTSNNNIHSSHSHKRHSNSYTAQDFKQHFATRGFTENQILNQRCLYMFDEFVKFAQTYSSYKCTIQQLHAELKNLHWWQKAYYTFTGTYCSGLQKRIQFLYNQLHTLKNQTPTHNEPIIRDISLETFQTQLSEYRELKSTYQEYAPSLSHAIDKRLDAYHNLAGANNFLHYVGTSYNLNNNVKQLLHKYNCDTARFTQCYGNKVQHAIHQESLNLLDRIDHLSPNSMLYDHQEALVDFTVAMVDYNHEGLTDKATTIADFCWTLLDYGQAITEGAALGIHSAITDILNNPIEATVAIVASKPLLAYQLSKVLYNVADIGITAITNLDHAKDKWNKYAEPLNNIIDAISKKKITMRDAVKGSTAFVVGLTAQSKLLGGLGKFCNTIKQKSINFAKNNPLLKPQEYLTTPEGLLFKATANTNKLKQSGQATASHLKSNVENKVTKIQPSINQTSIAILKNGYYEVNGFKFTEYYYNRLWKNGRGAPSLIAKSILDNTLQIIPDPEKIPGFFKYFAEGWEMVYNPTTKIVSHIQQLKIKK
ncbi:MAG TPA: hypothetical protein VHX42_03010 [Candidatus Babeliales bacterium]|nr:hypothetical protein [Candidatus Babeliales bacterium]